MDEFVTNDLPVLLNVLYDREACVRLRVLHPFLAHAEKLSAQVRSASVTTGTSGQSELVMRIARVFSLVNGREGSRP